MILKEILKKKVPGIVKWLNQLYNHLYHLRFYGSDNATIFSLIYRNNHWGSNESVSGPGSSLCNTRILRTELPSILRRYNIKSMVDIPCGDFNWMSMVNLDGIKYIGLDIVPEIIKSNSNKWLTDNRSFEIADITASVLPKADLIFCRDCFVHLSYKDIKKAIENIKKSNSLYILTTTFTNSTNFNILTGNWRPINLQSKEFKFPTPLEVISEGGMDEYKDKSMALWKIIDLP